MGAMYIAIVNLPGFRAGVVAFALDARYQNCKLRGTSKIDRLRYIFSNDIIGCPTTIPVTQITKVSVIKVKPCRGSAGHNTESCRSCRLP